MLDNQNEELETEEFEEIHSDEVDRVVEKLAELMESVESETIGDYLEEASNKIFELVYDEDDVEVAEDETDVLEGEEDEYEEYEIDEDDALGRIARVRCRLIRRKYPGRYRDGAAACRGFFCVFRVTASRAKIQASSASSVGGASGTASSGVGSSSGGLFSVATSSTSYSARPSA